MSTDVIGWLSDVPWFYVWLAAGFLFAMVTTGLLRFDEWRTRTTIAKDSPPSPDNSPPNPPPGAVMIGGGGGSGGRDSSGSFVEVLTIVAGEKE